jgi:hypothetical protein
VPTEWEGTFTIERSVNANWSVTRPIPHDKQDAIGMFSTKASGAEGWQGTLTMDKVHFTTAGLGSGTYDYKISGDQSMHQTKDGKIQCENDDRPKSVTETLDIKASGRGEELGEGSLQLLRRDLGDGKLAYAVSWTRPGTGLSAISGPRFASRGTSEHRWTDCDGSHDVSSESPLMSRFSISRQMLLGGPTTPKQSLWLPFDLDTKELVGSTEWEDEPDLGPDAPSFWVSTRMSWSIHRVIPPGLAAGAGK